MLDTTLVVVVDIDVIALAVVIVSDVMNDVVETVKDCITDTVPADTLVIADPVVVLRL